MEKLIVHKVLLLVSKFKCIFASLPRFDDLSFILLIKKYFGLASRDSLDTFRIFLLPLYSILISSQFLRSYSLDSLSFLHNLRFLFSRSLQNALSLSPRSRILSAFLSCIFPLSSANTVTFLRARCSCTCDYI